MPTVQTPICVCENVKGKEGVAWPRTGCGGPLLDGGQEAVRNCEQPTYYWHLDDEGILSPRLSSSSASSSEKDRDSQRDMILLGSRLGIHREPAVSGQGRVAMKGEGGVCFDCSRQEKMGAGQAPTPGPARPHTDTRHLSVPLIQ